MSTPTANADDRRRADQIKRDMALSDQPLSDAAYERLLQSLVDLRVEGENPARAQNAAVPAEIEPESAEAHALADLEYVLDRWRATAASGGPLHDDAKELIVKAALAVHAARSGRVEESPSIDPSDLARVRKRASRIFAPGAVEDWLWSREERLNDARPIDALARGRVEEVLDALDGVEQQAWG